MEKFHWYQQHMLIFKVFVTCNNIDPSGAKRASGVGVKSWLLIVLVKVPVWSTRRPYMQDFAWSLSYHDQLSDRGFLQFAPCCQTYTFVVLLFDWFPKTIMSPLILSAS